MLRHNESTILHDSRPEVKGAGFGYASEQIQVELQEARFISGFMAAVCSSLELDEICSIAARALYAQAPYYRVVFAFSATLEGKTVTISPMIQKGMLDTKFKNSSGSPAGTLTEVNEDSLASIHIKLRDDLGSIAIYHKPEHDKTLSDPLLENIALCFSQAIKNTLEHSRIKNLAMRDSLTDLFNRRTFDETLAQKVKCPDLRPLSLLLIDLDNFKQVNDTFGHQAGDQVLKTFATILKESCRGNDLVARFGGEEFAIILSQTKTATAHAIAQRIRNRVAKTVFTFGEQKHRMTVSMGLATCQEVATIFTSNLIKRADRALYQAKKTGKNKVCVFPADLLTNEASAAGEEGFYPFAPAGC
ncbi:MAG: GGDEF domain-containing protein [Desulfuromonadaceae bacterium]|nr:GGDEF domain-containing protein [Desulfuromonadaceae bacterium]MDD5105074.1 GGDEF domain-containing protein [Desulfuromonadaceae bacterium]